MERRGLRNLHVVDEVRAADWIVGGVESFSRLVVGTLVPRGFEGYARLFHPAYRFESAHVSHPAEGSHPDQQAHPAHAHLAHLHETEIRWDTVAEEGERRAHAGMQWPAIAGDCLCDEEPECGSLPIGQATELLAVLRRFTGSEDGFFAVWDGFGGLSVPVDDTKRVEMPGRPMILFQGPLADAAEVSMEDWPWQQSPSLWWPADRAWCVATDADQNSTYLGATAPCVEALVAAPGLEVWPVDREQSLTSDSDTVNARTAVAASGG